VDLRAHFNSTGFEQQPRWGRHLLRERYSLFSVLIVMMSPSTTKCGT
jgi:hypothetical protein